MFSGIVSFKSVIQIYKIQKKAGSSVTDSLLFFLYTTSDLWYNNEGAFFFIDEKHYCYIRSGLEDTEIRKIVNALSFDRVYF